MDHGFTPSMKNPIIDGIAPAQKTTLAGRRFAENPGWREKDRMSPHETLIGWRHRRTTAKSRCHPWRKPTQQTPESPRNKSEKMGFFKRLQTLQCRPPSVFWRSDKGPRRFHGDAG
jgi:hypothetical protein